MLVSHCHTAFPCWALPVVTTNIYWLPWCLPRLALSNIILFPRKIILRPGVSCERLCVTTSRLQTQICSTKSDRLLQTGDWWLAGLGSGLKYMSGVLHRMSSDLIIMDIWSSHSHSHTANHKPILTLPHLSSPHLTSLINYDCEYGNLVSQSGRLGLQVSKKRNKTKLVIVLLVVLTSQGSTPSPKYLKWKENFVFLQTLGDFPSTATITTHKTLSSNVSGLGGKKCPLISLSSWDESSSVRMNVD